MRESEMWGIWNACNGIFDETISYSREEVEAKLANRSYGDGRVVPILARVEPRRSHNYRWLEADAATVRAVEGRGCSVAALDDLAWDEYSPQSDAIEKPLQFVKEILERHDMRPGGLATAVGLAPSTLTRALNDPEHQFVLSTKTLQRIKEWDARQTQTSSLSAVGES